MHITSELHAASTTNRETPVVLHARVVSGTGGGPEKTILNSPRFLSELGYHAVCAYMHPPGDPGFDEVREKARQLEAPLVCIEDRGAWDLRVVTRLLRTCREQRVTIWHGHDYKSNAIGLLLRRLWPMRLVTTVHGWVRYTKRTPLYYGIDRYCLRHYERVICVSEDLHRRCVDSGVPADRCRVLRNAIDTDQFTRRIDVPDAKRRLGFRPERLLVGAVGRLSDEKGFDGLIRAVDRLIGRGLDIELVLIGEGSERPRLESLASELHREDRIRIMGFRSDVVEVYQAMDVVASSSIREGLPNVLLEAMALEIPVVATRLAGVADLVDNDQNGLLVDPGNEEELEAALARLLGDAELRSRLGHSGRQTIERDFSFRERMEKMGAIYDELLGVGSFNRAPTGSARQNR